MLEFRQEHKGDNLWSPNQNIHGWISVKVHMSGNSVFFNYIIILKYNSLISMSLIYMYLKLAVGNVGLVG